MTAQPPSQHSPAGPSGPAGAVRAWCSSVPAVFVMLLVGLFPFLWSVAVSFQDLTGSNRAGNLGRASPTTRSSSPTRASGRRSAARFCSWPWRCRSSLLLGLLLALHFQPDRPLKRLFVALLVLPAVVSPMVAGSMWRLMFDHKFGPVQPDHRLGRRRTGGAAVGGQAASCLLGDPHRRGLAVDAVHVHHPAGGARQRRPRAARGGGDRRRRPFRRLLPHRAAGDHARS